MLDVKKLLTKMCKCYYKPVIAMTYSNSTQFTLSAHASTSRSITIPAVSGYKVLCACAPRTNGAIASIYLDSLTSGISSGSVTVWVRNASTGSITVSSVSTVVLYMRNELWGA